MFWVITTVILVVILLVALVAARLRWQPPAALTHADSAGFVPGRPFEWESRRPGVKKKALAATFCIHPGHEWDDVLATLVTPEKSFPSLG
jgi:hypothetical protein